MPPIRRPQVGNLVSKTMARIEWYLREAVPLFLIGTALLFFLDFFKLLGWVHRAGEPIVHHLLGFGRENGVSDRVSGAGYRPFRGTIRIASVRIADVDHIIHPDPEIRSPATAGRRRS